MARTTLQRTLSPAEADHPRSSVRLSEDSLLAAQIKALVVSGKHDAARERFAGLVSLQQQRATRIAYHYLRDAYDADEAVQDAFVKVFTHIVGYREELPFEVWFTRILVNGCLDLRKARARRLRWVLPTVTANGTAPPRAGGAAGRARGSVTGQRTRASDYRGRGTAALAPTYRVYVVPDCWAECWHGESDAGA